ncbi:hypothetical protein TNCV_1989941 [Trichonephila clavipes]|nr:hypothetical protein TNCV_1989941 [Trichonephila clavipes]
MWSPSQNSNSIANAIEEDRSERIFFLVRLFTVRGSTPSLGPGVGVGHGSRICYPVEVSCAIPNTPRFHTPFLWSVSPRLKMTRKEAGVICTSRGALALKHDFLCHLPSSRPTFPFCNRLKNTQNCLLVLLQKLIGCILKLLSEGFYINIVLLLRLDEIANSWAPRVSAKTTRNPTEREGKLS